MWWLWVSVFWTSFFTQVLSDSAGKTIISMWVKALILSSVKSFLCWSLSNRCSSLAPLSSSGSSDVMLKVMRSQVRHCAMSSSFRRVELTFHVLFLTTWRLCFCVLELTPCLPEQVVGSRQQQLMRWHLQVCLLDELHDVSFSPTV